MLDLNIYVTAEKKDERRATFSLEPLASGYGHTLGNSLRRVLLSSLEGAAIDNVRLEGVEHEFSTIPHVKEDVVEIILNLKQLRFELNADSAILELVKKGKGVVTAKDFAPNAECRPTDPTQPIATLDAGGELNMTIVVKKGRGYETVEMKHDRTKAVGLIYIDSSYSPIVSAAYKVEKTRVGQETNLDRVILEVTTDGSLTPEEALQQACQILVHQFSQIGRLPQPEEESDTEPEAETAAVELTPVTPKTKVEEAGFSSRTTNALLASGYKTMSGLARLSEIKLESIKGLGSKGLEEVKSALERLLPEDK